MNAVEEIQAAIENLTELKNGASRAEWSAWRMYRPARGTFYGVEDGDVNEIAFTRTQQDAELIEVLHRTIDAQLTILSGEVNFCRVSGFSPARNKVDLARAINGATA